MQWDRDIYDPDTAEGFIEYTPEDRQGSSSAGGDAEARSARSSAGEPSKNDEAAAAAHADSGGGKVVETVPDLRDDLAALTPRDIVIKDVTDTSVTVQYSLAPGKLPDAGPQDIKILIRPSKFYREWQSRLADLEHKKRTRIHVSGWNNQDRHDKDNAKTLEEEIDLAGDKYVDSLKNLIPLDPGCLAHTESSPWDDYPKLVHAEIGPNGFFEVNLDETKLWRRYTDKYTGAIAVTASPETHTVTIPRLISGKFYDIAFVAKRTSSTNEDGYWGKAMWSKFSEPLTFTTKMAPWQVALQGAGLRHLIEPFTLRGLNTFESWMDLPMDVKVDLDIHYEDEMRLRAIAQHKDGIVETAQTNFNQIVAKACDSMNTYKVYLLEKIQEITKKAPEGQQAEHGEIKAEDPAAGPTTGSAEPDPTPEAEPDKQSQQDEEQPQQDEAEEEERHSSEQQDEENATEEKSKDAQFHEAQLLGLVPSQVKTSVITDGSVIVEYNLPPGCTAECDVDVKILIRPSKIYKELIAEVQRLGAEQTAVTQNYYMGLHKNIGKASFNKVEEEKAIFVRSLDVRDSIIELWEGYETNARKLLPFPPGKPSVVEQYFDDHKSGSPIVDGYFAYDPERNVCSPLVDLKTVGTISVKRSQEKDSVIISGLVPNMFYEVAVIVKRSGEDDESDGETRDEKIWCPITNPVGFSTKSANWQLALEKAGLRHLIRPFDKHGFTSYETWMIIPHSVKEELGIDAAIEAQLSDILSRNGVITEEDRKKIESERDSVREMLTKELKKLKTTQEALTTGDAVQAAISSDKEGGPKFGVIVTVNGEHCTVRWEDPNSTDPSNNAILEENVPTSSLRRTQYAFFLSHAQGDAQNQIAHLSLLLRDRGAKAWFDMDTERLEAYDMARGIYNSKVFVLYLTKSYFNRRYPKFEISLARELKKPIIIVYEPDERFGGTGDYIALVNECTKSFDEYKDFLTNIEAIPMARRAFQRGAVVDEIIKRGAILTSNVSDKSVEE